MGKSTRTYGITGEGDHRLHKYDVSGQKIMLE